MDGLRFNCYDDYPSASSIASSLGVAVGAVTDVLEELVQQNKIRRVGPTSDRDS
jgi:DNA-binding MarR family transcriptional regulator